MQSTLEKFQAPLIDCYLILFLHSMSPLKEDFIKFNDVQALFKIKIQNAVKYTNPIVINNKNFCQINQNVIFPLNIDELQKNSNSTQMELSLCNMLESQENKIIGQCQLQINYGSKQDKQWTIFHTNNCYSEIQTFIQISYEFVSIKDVQNLPNQWDKLYNKQIRDISAEDIPGNYNVNFEEFQFSFFLIEQLQEEIIGCNFIVKYTDKEICCEIKNSEFGSILKVPVIVPFVNRKVLFMIKDKHDNVIAANEHDLTNFFIMDKESYYALSFFNINKKNFLGRFCFNFTKKQMPSNKLAIFKQESLSNQQRELYLFNQDEKERFYLTFQIDFLSTLFEINQNLTLFLQWGQFKHQISIKKSSDKTIVVNELVKFVGEFYFINESIDFLPQVAIILMNEQQDILNYLYIKSEDIPFSSQCKFPLTFNKAMKNFTKDTNLVSIQFKCNFHQSQVDEIQRLDLENKNLNYSIVDLIAIKGQIEKNQELRFSYLNSQFTHEFDSNRNFQWLFKELIFQNEVYQNMIMPFSFYIKKSQDIIQKDYHLQNNLQGIPQWVKVNQDLSILVSIKQFNSQILLQEFLNLSKNSFEELKNRINKKDYIDVKDFQIELESKKIKLNFFKLQNISQQINILKLNNPVLKINLNPFVYDYKLENQDHFKTIAPQIPLKYQNQIANNDILYIKQEIELELDFPKDKRLLQTIKVEFLQQKDNQNINLGNSELDLFELYYTNELNLYRKLKDLQENLEQQNSKNRKQILKIIQEKLKQIEQEFIFVEEFQPLKGRQYERIENMSEIQIQNKKKQNYFHKIKEELIEKANGLTDTEKQRISSLINKRISNPLGQQHLVNLNDLVVYVEDKPDFERNEKKQNYRLIAKHSNQKAHWRFEESNELEYTDFMLSDRQQNFFDLVNENHQKNGQLHCTMDIQEKKYQEFFSQLRQFGIDTSLLQFKDRKYKKFQPNEKIKMRLYLTDLLLNKNFSEALLYEVYLDETLIQKKSILNKEEIKKKQKFLGFQMNQKIKNCFTIGDYQNLTIIFYKQNQNKTTQEIGRTTLDINRRLNCNIWRSLVQVPIEKRPIKQQDSSIEQGSIKMWLEMFTKDQKISFPDYEISKYNQQEQYEVRVVVWSIENLGQTWGFKNKDNFLRVSMNTEIFPFEIDEKFSHKYQYTEPIQIKNSQKLVTVNYRFIWRFKQDGYRKNFNSLLNIKIANDFEQFEVDRKVDCSDQLEMIIKQKRGRKSIVDDKQELLCFSEEHPQGIKMLISLDILNEEDIMKRPAGLGRNYPNANPYLEQPNENSQINHDKFLGFNKKQLQWLFLAFVSCFFMTLISTYYLTKILV